MKRVQPIGSLRHKARLPTNDRGGSRLQPLLDLVEGEPFAEHQDQLGAEDISGRKERDCAISVSSARWASVRTNGADVATPILMHLN
jgi:hypothetical protein